MITRITIYIYCLNNIQANNVRDTFFTIENIAFC